MAEVILLTHPLSPFGWAAALTAAEKGVPYRMAPVDAGSPEHLDLHPFGKMPVLRHGELVVYETLAIVHYLDLLFPGPALEPEDPLKAVAMLRWMSVVNSYVFPTMNGLVKERLATFWRTDPPDEASLAALRPALARQVALIDRAVADHGFLACNQFTLADAYLFPHLHLASLTVDGAAALESAPAARTWLDRMRARPSFAATNPFEMA